MPTPRQGKNGSESLKLVVASDTFKWDRVGEELTQLSLGRDRIVLLVCSYLLNVNQQTSRNTANTNNAVDDNWELGTL